MFNRATTRLDLSFSPQTRLTGCKLVDYKVIRLTFPGVYITSPSFNLCRTKHTTAQTNFAMTADESTQTNGLPGKIEPKAGLLDKSATQEESWSVESGMS
jgi:hypothetical protein